MSEPTSETITCPGCGHQQAFAVWESLNVTLDPKLKEQLIDGRLTTFTCEECSEQAEVVSSLLYHDMAKQVMIWLIPGDEEPEKLDPGALAALGDMARQGYTLRLVRSKNHLIEKIMIFDDRLDDRMIELLKAALRIRTEQDGRSFDGVLLYEGVSEGESGPSEMHLAVLGQGDQEAFVLPWEVYLKFAAEYVNALPNVDEERGRWLQVDESYAEALIQE